MDECPSRLTLAQWQVGDLPEAEREAVERHLAGCSKCGEALENLRANIATYEPKRGDHLARLRARLDVERGSLRQARGRRRGLRAAAVVGGLAAAAAVALVLALGGNGEPDLPEHGIAYKGAMSMHVVAKRGSDQFEVADGTELHQGDLVRFVITTASPGWLTVFSLDAGGIVSPFYPSGDAGSEPEPLRLEAPGRHELPGSMVLDDALGVERFIAVFSANPYSRADLFDRAAQTGARDPGWAGEGMTVEVLAVRKTEGSR